MHRSVPDLGRVARSLDEAGAQYVLVGGLAIVLQGGSYPTYDADLAVGFTLENRRTIASALAPLNPRPFRLAAGAAWVWDELCIRAPWSIFETDAGRIDLLVRLPGIDSFQGLYERSLLIPFEQTQVRIASLDDLLAMKGASDRTKDRLHEIELQALKRMRTDG